MQNDLISKELSLYQQCSAAASSSDMTSAMVNYIMINTNNIASLVTSFVNSKLSHDGKNRSTTEDQYGETSPGLPSSGESDSYYIQALILIFNDFLNDQKESLYYDQYCQAASILLISIGLKDYIEKVELSPDIAEKSQQVLVELQDRLEGLVRTAKEQCRILQPELYDKFLDLGGNLINEATNVVIGRWFTNEDGSRQINEELEQVLKGLRVEYLRIVKRNGYVEVGLLLELFHMNSTTYIRYRKEIINGVAKRCDMDLIHYIKQLFLTQQNN